jgi:dinuclear metal center YbgI/SA1388 family protein
MTVDRDGLVAYMDALLRVADFEDGAWNGLQVEGAREVKKIAVAVDACDVVIERAVAAGCQLLITHHGMYWGKGFRITGAERSKVKALLDGELSLYAVHLPLDAHPEVGNNAELLRMLGAHDPQPFGYHRGTAVGWRGRFDRALTLTTVARRLERGLGTHTMRFVFGPEKVAEVGVISGAGGFGVLEAATSGLPLLVTGEWEYSKLHSARDHQVSVITAGHYKTETTGVQALARHLENHFKLPWQFIDFPFPL